MTHKPRIQTGANPKEIKLRRKSDDFDESETSTTHNDSVTKFWYNYTFICPFCEEKDGFSTQNPHEANSHLKTHGITLVNIEELLPFFHEYLDEIVSSIQQKGIKSASCEYDSIQQLDVFKDKPLRERLRNQKLAEMLLIQEQERQEQTSLACPFCNILYTSRSDLFSHMSTSHHDFYLGQPDNIVRIRDLLHILSMKINRKECIYCERQFRDVKCLKDHMRKKKHYKIGKRNREMDQFYIINFTECGWLDNGHDENIESWENDDDVNVPNETAVCLFDDRIFQSTESVYEHMKIDHGFDIHLFAKNHGLEFYDLIKLVNYIRSKTRENECFCCEQKFESNEEVVEHMARESHFSTLPDDEDWKDEKYMFPTLENDALLFDLDFDMDDTELEEIPSQLQNLTLEERLDIIERANKITELL